MPLSLWTRAILAWHWLRFSYRDIVALGHLSTQGTALRLAIKSNLSTLVVTIHYKLTQNVHGQSAHRGRNGSGQHVPFRRQLFQLRQAPPRGWNCPREFIHLKLEARHVPEQPNLTGQGTIKAAVIHAQEVCGVKHEVVGSGELLTPRLQAKRQFTDSTQLTQVRQLSNFGHERSLKIVVSNFQPIQVGQQC